MLTVNIENDPFADNPLSDGAPWRFVQFDDRFVDSEDIDDYFHYRNGRRVAATIGLARKLKFGTAFRVSLYEHSGRVYSLAGEGTQCQWDTTGTAGILLGDVKSLPKTFAERQADARIAIQQYTDWAEGAVYRYGITDENGEDIDSCTGFYDAEYMMKEIEDALSSHPGEPVVIEGEAAWLTDYNSIHLDPLPEKYEDLDADGVVPALVTQS